MAHRAARRWSTPFGRWVGSYTVARLCEDLANAGRPVTEKAVYGWVAGRGQPRLVELAVMESVSRGRVNARVIVQHAAVVRVETE